MINSTTLGRFSLWLPALLAVVAGQIPAQSVADEPQPSDTLAEIVITATKRESTVQTTPISVTAISGVDIQERGVSDFTALLQSVPGVSMRTAGPGMTEYEMRGMSSTGGDSATVGFYLDDVPLSAPAQANVGKVVIDPNLYDLNRVEVLRGPQGTLYGSGSMGGTLKIITNAPNPEEFEASAQTTFSDTDGGGFNHAENGMVNLPMGSTAALRIVASQSHDSGWVNRIVTANGDFPLETNSAGAVDPAGTVRGNAIAAPVAKNYNDVNDANYTGARASLLWKPTDQLSITPSYFYQRTTQNGLNAIDSNPGTNAHYQPFDFAEPFSDRFDLGSLNVQYRTDWFDVNSTTARWMREEDINQDSSEQWQSAFALPSFYVSQGGIGPSSSTLEADSSKQTSEELRVTSLTNSDFKWLIGYFYSDLQSQWNNFYDVPGAAPLFGTANIYTQYQPSSIIQRSVFGELSYDVTSKLKATVGLRRYDYKASTTTSVSGAASSTGSNAITTYTAPESDQGLTPKFDISYQFAQALLYATVSKGFRPGGGTGPVPTAGAGALGSACEANLQAIYGTSAAVPSPKAFAPDHVWSYELGEKMEAFSNRLTVDSAVYFENWQAVQQIIPLNCGYSFIANAGDAHVWGSELEIRALLLPALVLSANAGYTHAYIAKPTISAPGISPGVEVQNVPDWTSSVSLTYRRHWMNELTFSARIENDYVGPRTDVTYTTNNLPGYSLAQLRVGIEGDRWSTVFFAKNLFNDRAFLSDMPALTINLPTYNRIVVSQPLTIGVELNYRLGGSH